jgi:hypothetical protein
MSTTQSPGKLKLCRITVAVLSGPGMGRTFVLEGNSDTMVAGPSNISCPDTYCYDTLRAVEELNAQQRNPP